MAMRLESTNVHIIESQILSELDYWGAENTEAEKTLAYIAGVHDMANAVIKAIRELGGH